MGRRVGQRDNTHPHVEADGLGLAAAVLDAAQPPQPLPPVTTPPPPPLRGSRQC
jgi:hypothetical protein